MLAFDAQAHSEQVAALVRSSGANLGAVIDPDGERLTLVDDEGRILSHTDALLALVSLISNRLLGDRIALPVAVTSAAARLAARHNVGVELTTMSAAGLDLAATQAGVGFAGGLDGGYIIPGFLPAFDASAALVKLLDLLAHHRLKLSSVVDDLPRVHQSHETVATPWEHKGLVMRALMETAGGPTVLVDGVRVEFGDAWVLALPDPEDAITHVYAEAATESEAGRLTREFVLRIRELVR